MDAAPPFQTSEELLFHPSVPRSSAELSAALRASFAPGNQEGDEAGDNAILPSSPEHPSSPGAAAVGGGRFDLPALKFVNHFSTPLFLGVKQLLKLSPVQAQDVGLVL